MPDTKSLKGRGSPHPVRSGTAGPLRANLGTLMTHRYGVDEERLAQITCYRANARITVDGDLSKPAWRDVPRSSRFVDMVSGEPALYDTRVACQWDQERFYVAYWIEEPQVKATLTERDSFIWNDHDVEIFVAGDDCYYELEINALGTTWDLLLSKPYKDDGKAVNGWEIAGLKSAIHLDGTLNDPFDTDRGWSLELALPWKALAELARRPSPPAATMP